MGEGGGGGIEEGGRGEGWKEGGDETPNNACVYTQLVEG